VKGKGVIILVIIENGVIVLEEGAYLNLMDKQPHIDLLLPGYAENTISIRVKERVNAESVGSRNKYPFRWMILFKLESMDKFYEF